MFICGLDEMGTYRARATHLISISDPDSEDEMPALGLPKQKRLVLKFHDLDRIDDAETGFDGRRQVAPKEADVRKALAFASRLASLDYLLIHCHQGISRSTAMGFAVLCQAHPEISEKTLLSQIIRIRPEAVPNKLIVKYADKILRRKGRMIRALNRIYGR